MTNGKFKRLGRLAYALAPDVMSTQSATGFEWSVKLVGAGFRVGIVSLKTGESVDFHGKDKNAILYNIPIDPPRTITNGLKIIHSNLPEHKDEDIIRFRFQPHAKKLVINLVRVLKLHINLK